MIFCQKTYLAYFHAILSTARCKFVIIYESNKYDKYFFFITNLCDWITEWFATVFRRTDVPYYDRSLAANVSESLTADRNGHLIDLQKQKKTIFSMLKKSKIFFSIINSDLIVFFFNNLYNRFYYINIFARTTQYRVKLLTAKIAGNSQTNRSGAVSVSVQRFDTVDRQYCIRFCVGVYGIRANRRC